MQVNFNDACNLSRQMYSTAFIKLFKCNQTDFTIKVDSDGDAALVSYKDKRYLIETYDSLYSQVQCHLTDVENTQYLGTEYLAFATAGILSNTTFHNFMLQMLSSQHERGLYQLALTISSCFDVKEPSFWEIIRPLDTTGVLLSKATMAAARAIGVDNLTDKILQLQISNGLQCYNQLSDGIFEKVSIKHDDRKEVVLFIYSINNMTSVV
jgi:hypothetical protein